MRVLSVSFEVAGSVSSFTRIRLMSKFVTSREFIPRFYAFPHSPEHIFTPVGCRGFVGGLSFPHHLLVRPSLPLAAWFHAVLGTGLSFRACAGRASEFPRLSRCSMRVASQRSASSLTLVTTKVLIRYRGEGHQFCSPYCLHQEAVAQKAVLINPARRGRPGRCGHMRESSMTL